MVYPPKVKKNTFSFPTEIVYTDDSYLTKIAVPSEAYKFGLGESLYSSPKKNSKLLFLMN